MTEKTHIHPDEKIGLKLTGAERKLILEGLIHIDDELAVPIRNTPANAPVMLTLDDLDDLAGCVAAEANHTTNKGLRKKLDAIFSKIQDLLGTYTDQAPPESLKIADAGAEALIVERTVQLAEWAAEMLIGAEQLGIKTRPVAHFPLPEAERAVLLVIPSIYQKLRKKLATEKPKLTVGEVGGLLVTVAEALLDATPLESVALLMTARSLMNCLEAEVEGAIKPAGPAGKTGTIYRLRITLADIDPAIWRLVEVPDCSLGELHDVIQIVMGWQDSHLHQFVLDGKSFGPDTPYAPDLEVEDEEGVRLSQVFTDRKRPRILYEYDFGDSWRHEIRLEKMVKPEPNVKYPRCLEGARACPPEDCGGPWGYVDFLAAISDPKHENHRDMKEWIGGKFDPEKFSVGAVNKTLRKVDGSTP
jgi:Plasmid pRiA4b ORF-3-like protein